MPWFRDTFGTIWIWVKGKWLVITAAIAILGGGAVTQILQEGPILQEHLLKADRAKILLSKEVDWIEWDEETGERMNRGRIISYDYISDKEVPRAMGENISKRTGNAQFFLKEKNEKEEVWIGKFYVGTPFFYIPHENKWYQTETATTAIKAFNKQMEVGFFEKLFGREAFALSTTTYSGNADGGCEEDDGGWATVVATTTSGADVCSSGSAQENACAGFCDPTVAKCMRSWYPINTSILPDDAIVSAVTFNFYIAEYLENCGTNRDIVIVESLLANGNTAPATDKWNKIGTIAWSIAKTFTATGATSTEFNAIGIGEISLTDFTMVAMRTVWFDIGGNTPVNNTDEMRVSVRMSNYAGTDYDPNLVIEYSLPPPTTCTCPDPAGHWNVDSGDNCWISSNCDIRDYTLYLHDTGSGALNIIDNTTIWVEDLQATSADINIESGSKILSDD